MTEINGRVRKIEKRLNDMGPGLPFEDSVLFYNFYIG